MYDLTIVIPARNELFLGNTIADIFAHSEAKTEVIAVCDGSWPVVKIPDDPRLTIISTRRPAGERIAANRGAALAKSPWIMKVDAHCSFDQGFDRKMLELAEPDATYTPALRNLHAFDWVCIDGHRRYQDISGPCQTRLCPQCGADALSLAGNPRRMPHPGYVCHGCGHKLDRDAYVALPVCGAETGMDVVWHAKPNPTSVCFRFNTDFHFEYWKDGAKAYRGQKIVPSFSLQGSCFMLMKKRWLRLDICDESWPIWGQQGVEVAMKSWLSGGRVLVNATTWYAHLFRTKGGSFGFPYEMDVDMDALRAVTRRLFVNNEWAGAVRTFQSLVAEFRPPGWWNGDQ